MHRENNIEKPSKTAEKPRKIVEKPSNPQHEAAHYIINENTVKN